MFKEKFKYYKKRKPEPNLENVLKITSGDPQFLSQFETLQNDHFDDQEAIKLGLKHISEWKIYEFKQHPGLIFIANPFTNLGQRYWIARSVADYSNPPSITNLCSQDDLHSLLNHRTWWEIVSCYNSDDAKLMSKKLRWATMGYHHNWDTKVYSEESKGPFPNDLTRLSNFIVKTVLNKNFEPEASIVNFYLMDSFLSGHADRSEANTTAPLVSLSFGQTAIFLIGGNTLEENPNAVFLESGDIILMVGNSRFSYHGVPKIIRCCHEYWNDFTENYSIIDCIIKSGSWDIQSSHNAKNLVENITYGGSDRVTMEKVRDVKFWEPFAHYVKDARINLNVRQVFSTTTDE